MYKQTSVVFLTLLSILMSSSIFAEPVWVDVRSSLEHMVDSIEGDVRISHSDIVEEFNALHPDKETDVRLYCRSGGRAETALALLKDAGYKNVINVGSIDDARRDRGIAE